MPTQAELDRVAELDKQIAALRGEQAVGSSNPYYMVGQDASAGVKKNKQGQSKAVTSAAIAGASSMGVGAVLVGLQDSFNRYKAYKKQARGGPMTEQEVQKTMTAPYADFMPHNNQLAKYNPMFQIAGKFLGTTKNADQVYRDRVRKDLQKVGFLNQQDKTDYTVKFSDGAVFDLGKDGNAKLINADGKGERKYREIDFTNPLAQTGLNHTNGLAHLVTAGVPDKKGTKYDYAGYFTNAVTEGAKDEGMIKGRAKELYTKAGFDSIEKADAAYDAMVEAGRISKEEAAAFKQEARSVGLASEAKPAEEQQRQTQFRLPEDTPISKKRLNSRFDTGFTARPVANDVSTGVSQYLSMVDQMAKRRQ